MSEVPTLTPVHDSARLFFLSGTGNTYRAATWLRDQAAAAGVSPTLRPLDSPGDLAALPRGPRHLLGLLTPTHGFTAPWSMMKFAWRLPPGEGTRAFVLATRAGTKVGSLFLPGMEGTACYVLALILALKGYVVRGVLGLDLPSNWLAVHPGFREASARALTDRARPTAERFGRRMLEGGAQFGYATFICLALGLQLAQISLMYLIMARFMLAKLFFASPACTGCGQCARQCPVHAIRMWGHERPRPYWSYGCESCMRCMAYCPTRAIQAGHSWCAILFYVTGIPVSQFALNWLTPHFPWAAHLTGAPAMWLIQYPYMLLSAALTYAVFTLLLRVPAINYLFTYTTLTTIYRRYQAPDVKAEEMTGE